MPRIPDEFEDVYRALSVPAAADPSGLSRRRFLQAAVGGAGAAAVLPSWLAADAAALPDAAMAAPIGPNDGVLVLIQMGGGNDGLNMVAPTGNGRYYDRRGGLAVQPAQALDLGSGFGLHPELTGIKARWDSGNVAVVHGVGEYPADLSHFTSTAFWMQGWGGGSAPAGGWVGRYLDGLGADPLHGVCLGTSTPLHCVGATTKATALPVHMGGTFGADPSDPTDARLYACVQAFAAQPTGLGVWGDALAHSGSDTITLAQTVTPLYEDELPDAWILRSLTLAARLINANLGLRVISCVYGDFDSHASQPTMHTERMAELDASVEAFYDELDAVWSPHVAIATWSEFGRRLDRNDSNGTDHGEASTLLVVGDNVAGGFYGEAPSLEEADLHWGNPVSTVNFLDVYGTLVESWLAADPVEVLGSTRENLGFFAAPPG